MRGPYWARLEDNFATHGDGELGVGMAKSLHTESKNTKLPSLAPSKK